VSNEEPLGPVLPPSPSKHAERAMLSLRQLNEATARDGGHGTPPVMYATLTRLTHALRDTAKAIEEASRWPKLSHQSGRVGTDDVAGHPVGAAVDALNEAAAQAKTFSPGLDAASAAASHLTRVFETAGNVRHRDDSPPA
jgi:hypothetical protein